MVRSVGAVGTFVLGLHKKREKVQERRPEHRGEHHLARPPRLHRPCHGAISYMLVETRYEASVSLPALRFRADIHQSAATFAVR